MKALLLFALQVQHCQQLLGCQCCFCMVVMAASSRYGLRTFFMQHCQHVPVAFIGAVAHMPRRLEHSLLATGSNEVLLRILQPAAVKCRSDHWHQKQPGRASLLTDPLWRGLLQTSRKKCPPLMAPCWCVLNASFPVSILQCVFQRLLSQCLAQIPQEVLPVPVSCLI